MSLTTLTSNAGKVVVAGANVSVGSAENLSALFTGHSDVVPGRPRSEAIIRHQSVSLNN